MSIQKRFLRFLVILSAIISTLVMVPALSGKTPSTTLLKVNGNTISLDDFNVCKKYYSYVYSNKVLSLRSYLEDEIYYYAAIKEGQNPNVSRQEIEEFLKETGVNLNWGFSEVERISTWRSLKPFLSKLYIVHKYKTKHNICLGYNAGDFKTFEVSSKVILEVLPESNNKLFEYNEEDLQLYYENHIDDYRDSYTSVQCLNIPFDFTASERDIVSRYEGSFPMYPESRSGFLVNIFTDYSRQILEEASKKHDSFPGELVPNISYFFNDITLEQSSNVYTRSLFSLKEKTCTKITGDKYIWCDSITPMYKKSLKECRETIIADIREEHLRRFHSKIRTSSPTTLLNQYKSNVSTLYLKKEDLTDQNLLDSIKSSENKWYSVYNDNNVLFYQILEENILLDRYSSLEDAKDELKQDYLKSSIKLLNSSINYDISLIKRKSFPQKQECTLQNSKQVEDVLFTDINDKMRILNLSTGDKYMFYSPEGVLILATVEEAPLVPHRNLQVNNKADFIKIRQIVHDYNIYINPQVFSFKDSL